VFGIRNYRWQLLLFSKGCIEIQHATKLGVPTQKNSEEILREHEYVHLDQDSSHCISVERHVVAQRENRSQFSSDHQREQNRLLQCKEEYSELPMVQRLVILC
jgi:hypothetical protein